MITNLAFSLLALARDRKLGDALEDAVSMFDAALEHPLLEWDLAVRLDGGLAEALLLRHAFASDNDALDRAIDVLEAGLTRVLIVSAGLSVAYRLGRQESLAGVLTRRLVGALLERSRRRHPVASVSANADRRRALAVGEAGKNVLLTQELLRRSLVPPPDLDEGLEGLIEWEAMALARLAALDARELAASGATSPARAHEREELVAALNETWEEMLAATPSAQSYVAFRRDLPSALDEALAMRGQGSALLSVLRMDCVQSDGSFRYGLCGLAWWPGQTDPELVFDLNADPVPELVERFVAEVPGDRGREQVPETWQRILARHVPPRTLAPDVMLAVSPPEHGGALPWSLLLSRCGWADTTGSIPPVVTVPSLVLPAVPPAQTEVVWHEVPDLSEHLGIDVDDEVAENVRLTVRVPATSAGAPVVVGNPTSDLPSASQEAIAVGAILGVEPLLGVQATMAAVMSALANCTLVHLAAHVEFDNGSPLDSLVYLADGSLPAGQLIGRWSNAELVVLSACESGRGATVTGSEVLGFVTALLRAGARAVVASLWRVDDAATAYLMTHFHEQLAAGEPASQALARAQAWVRAQPGWDAPYYWAGFLLAQRGTEWA